MPRSARRPTYSVNSVNLVLLDLLKFLSSSRLLELGSDNSLSHFFKWLFTITWIAVSMVSGPESEQELAESHLMLKNNRLCFRMSSSFVCNNPSLQIHSFSEDRGKCNKTGNPSISDFSTILTSDIPNPADSSHLPSDEAYRQRLSLPCYLLATPCNECKPQARHFFDKIFIKAWFCCKEMCLFSHMTSVGWLEIMIHHTPSIICDFHLPVDFGLDIVFAHIFCFMHQHWVGIDGFTLTKLRHGGEEEKTLPSCSDTRSPMTASLVLLQSAFCALKKTDWPKLDCFKFLILDFLSAWRVSA